MRLRLPTVIVLGAALAFAQSDFNGEVQQHYRKAAEAMRLGKLDEAAGEFRAMVRLDPNLPEGRANLGGVYYYEGRATATNMISTYRTKYDHGTFDMKRPMTP